MINKIKKGNRNNTLFGVAFKKAFFGDETSEELRTFIYAYNEKYCDPPLNQHEIKALVGDVLNKVGSIKHENKLFKVYVVTVNYPRKLKSMSFFSFMERIEDSWDTVAVFSTRKKAENYIGKGEFPFGDEARGSRIDEWKVDYEIFWEEWNKLESK